MEKIFKNIMIGFIGALILSAILLGLRASALKSAYDSTASFTVNDSQGVVHTVAASGISGDTVALIYALLAGLVWLIFAAYAIFEVVKGFKHGG